ncbi:hypothetical protein JQC67_13690 [Aurantibacter crassamenti]|uniref:hypothetical protein n=1 Tax=Aurantibacter crassamenti TaxID=1837375 RepID=UPI00193A0C0E|nr:hypothetical protein [Aurantibacter crassamenti]MBM1107201.1 hypothetical protein [Aurantibacter crassamenti]
MTQFKGLIVLLFIISITGVQAQQATANEKEVNVKKYTVMEKFEPDYVLPVEERKRLKIERREIVAHRKSILDTLNISDRRRERLFRDLNKNPFSDRVNKQFAEIEFEDDADIEDQSK